MDLNGYLSGLQESVATIVRSATPEVQEAAEQLTASLEPALRLTLLEFASDITSDITMQLDGDTVDVRMRGGQPEIVVDRPPADEPPTAPTPPTAPPAPAGDDSDGGYARITLRLPEHLKPQVDEAAAAGEVSVNTWLVRAVQQALRTRAPEPPPASTSARRLTGWAR